MPRIARAVATDYPHHITQRGNNRAQVFFDDEDRTFYLSTLQKYARQYKVDIWAYCLMTNHVHFVAVPREDFSLARGIGLTNLVYTQYLNRKFGNTGRVWQNRFFSCPVETDTYLWAVIRYVVNNPVKAGMTERAVEYRWSSAMAHISGHLDPIVASDSGPLGVVVGCVFGAVKALRQR